MPCDPDAGPWRRIGTKGGSRAEGMTVRQLPDAEQRWLWDNGIDWDRTPA
jgi:hypothetical protein